MSKLLSRGAGFRVLLGLLQAGSLAASVLAHPIAGEDGAPPGSAGTHRSDAGQASAPADDHSPSGVLRPPPAIDITRESSAQWGGQSPLAVPAESAASSLDPASSAPRPTADAKSLRSMSPLPPATPEQDADPSEPELAASIRELRQSARDAMATVLDAHRDREGRVTFSLAGIDGFHYAAQGGEVSIGHGDAALTLSESGTGGGQTARGLQREPGSPDTSATREIIQFVLEIVQYPLVWLMIFLLVLGRIALMIARNRSRKRRGRGRAHARTRTRDEPGERSSPAKAVRQRKRIRFRIRHTPSMSSTQKL